MLSNETKIGLLTIVSLALLVWGYKFLKGKNILSNSTLLYVEYEDVDQLTVSSPVLRNGFQVGIVGDIQFKENMSTLEVTLDLYDNISVPKNAVANIVSTGFMGGKAIILEFGAPCSGNNCAESGDRLQGSTKNLVSSLLGEPKDLKPYMNTVEENIGGIVDSIKNNIVDPNGEPNPTVEDVKATIANLKSATARLDRLMATSDAKLNTIVSNAASITSNLEQNNDKINGILANVSSLTNNLSKADLAATVNKTNKAMDGASEAITSLKSTLTSADNAVNGLSNILTKVNNNEGTLGMLVNDKEMYNSLERTLDNMDFLLQDIRLNPQRYRRILSKKKMPYEAPENDPAFEN